MGDEVAGASAPLATAACGSASCSTRTSAKRSRGRSRRRPAHRAGPAPAARRAAEGDPRGGATSCTTSTRYATARRSGPARPTGRSTTGRGRRTCSRRWPRPSWPSAYARDFEQMWARGRVDERDSFDAPTRSPPGARACARGSAPAAAPSSPTAFAKRIGAARHGACGSASPVLTAGPILGTLNEVLAEGGLDVAGVCDATQIAQVFDQWERNPRSHWKAPLLHRALEVFHGKRSTPYTPDSIHDFMHAKITVADDTTSSARSTSRAQARRTRRTCSRSPIRRWPSGWRVGSTDCAPLPAALGSTAWRTCTRTWPGPTNAPRRPTSGPASPSTPPSPTGWRSSSSSVRAAACSTSAAGPAAHCCPPRAGSVRPVRRSASISPPGWSSARARRPTRRGSSRSAPR